MNWVIGAESRPARGRSFPMKAAAAHGLGTAAAPRTKPCSPARAAALGSAGSEPGGNCLCSHSAYLAVCGKSTGGLWCSGEPLSQENIFLTQPNMCSTLLSQWKFGLCFTISLKLFTLHTVEPSRQWVWWKPQVFISYPMLVCIKIGGGTRCPICWIASVL